MPAKLARLRSRAFFRQQDRCCYCDLPMWMDHPQCFAQVHGITLARLIGISALQNTFLHGRKAVLIPRPTSLQPASVATSSGGIGARGKHRSPTITTRSYRAGCRGSGDMVRGSLRVPRLHVPDRVNDPTAIPA